MFSREAAGRSLDLVPRSDAATKKGEEGDGKWVGHAHFCIPFEDRCFHERDGKPALAQDEAPSRGEPAEPRRFHTDQGTPSPKLGGTDNKTNTHEIHRERKGRGIRNKGTIERRRKDRNKHRSANRRMYRKGKKRSPQGRLAEGGHRSQATYNTSP